MNDYIESNEWVLVEHPAVRHVKRYPCCDEPYIDLTFIMKVKRMGAFYSYILILPCVLLSSITLVIFWLPPESSAKMILGKFFDGLIDMDVICWITAYIDWAGSDGVGRGREGGRGGGVGRGSVGGA